MSFRPAFAAATFACNPVNPALAYVILTTNTCDLVLNMIES
jgi:hypothetical protein